MRVLVLRDPRESERKCSLTPLRGRPDVAFVDYDPVREVDAEGHTLLTPDPEAPLLGPADRGRPLLVLDCAWRRVPALRRTVRGELHPRRLPPLETAYPRRSATFPDPVEGLASVEALFAASALLGEPAPDLLEGYRFGGDFLARNPDLVRGEPSSPPPAPAR